MIEKTLYEFITVEAAVKLLTRTYGQGAQAEASRRAHYARMARQRNNYQFWEEVLQKLANIETGPDKRSLTATEDKAKLAANTVNIECHRPRIEPERNRYKHIPNGREKPGHWH